MQHFTKEMINDLHKFLSHSSSMWNFYKAEKLPQITFNSDLQPICDHPYWDKFLDHFFDFIFANVKKEYHGTGIKDDKLFPIAKLKFSSCLKSSVMAQKIVECGIHELTISADQALGSADMHFNITPEEFMMPAESVFVYIPQNTFELDRFKDMLSDIVVHSNKLMPISMQGLIEPSFNSVMKRFSEVGAPLSVLVQKHNGNVISSKFNIGSQTFHFFCCGSTIENRMSLRASSHPKLYEDIHRIALSAVLISTVRPNMCHPRVMDASVAKDRAKFLGKIGEKGMKIEHASYFILQPDMKTYHVKSDFVESDRSRVSPDRVIIKPIFVHGHFRQQPYGEKRLLRRLQWIKACIRNKHLLKGERPVVITQAELTQPNDVIKDMVNVSRSVR